MGGSQQGSARPKNKLASVMSGSASGALVSACVQPLDVLRTRMQADVARGVYHNTLQTARAIVDQGGVRALWQGTQPTVIRLAFGAGIHFFFLETLRPAISAALPSAAAKKGEAGGGQTLSAGAAALVGGLSRTLAAMVSCPFTVVKTRMEYVSAHAGAAGGTAAAGGAAAGGAAAAAGSHGYRNTLHALGSIAQHEGLRGLYRGLGPTVLSNAPFSALYYMFYTRLQQQFAPAPGERPGPVVNFLSACAAATAATLLTQPADVARTRMQLGLGLHGSGAAGASAGARGLGSSFRLVGQIASTQGARGLLAGALPRVLKRTLQTALVWTIYEELYPRLSAASEWAAQQVREQRRHPAAGAPARREPLEATRSAAAAVPPQQ